MPTTVASTIGTGGTYSTLQAWEDAAPADLVAADQIWEGQCKNQTFSGTGTLLTVAGSTTDATRYKKLTTEAGASFADHASKLTNALRANGSNGALITSSVEYGNTLVCTEANFHLAKLQVVASAGSGYAPADLGAGTVIEQCILESSSGAGNTFRTCLRIISGEVRNSLLVVRGSNETFLSVGGTSLALRNCTLVSTGSTVTSLAANNYGTITLVNCAVFGVTNGNASNGTVNKTTCYTDASANNSGWTVVANNTTTGSGFENITDATRDFRIKSTSALVNAGTTDVLTATDIVGSTRSTYDVGAWEYAAPGVVSHATTGALSAAAATVSGTATHTAAPGTHPSSGALSAAAATVSGTAVHTSAATGTITTVALKNNTGTLLASTLVDKLVALKLSDMSVAATWTSQTTNSSGILTLTGVVAATDYLLVTSNTAGSAVGVRKYTAA